jgi:hypothetical protein
VVWLWNSCDEYVSHVDPQSIGNPAVLRVAKSESSFERQQRLFKAVAEFGRLLSQLISAGFNGSPDQDDIEVGEEVGIAVSDLLHAGEELLLNHRRLGLSQETYDFACCHDVEAHWERNLGSRRAIEQVNELVRVSRALLAKYHAIANEDSKALVDDLDLPDALNADFYLARNLFSSGFDAVAVLIAARGLEGVLRAIAARRKICIVIKGNAEPAAEADLHDLIETMFRVRWKVRNVRLISAQTRGLLQYLRTVRNAHAHASASATIPETEPRETATILARTANGLWSEGMSRARLVPLSIPRTW